MQPKDHQKPSADVVRKLADSLPTRASLLERLRNLGDAESWRVFFEMYWRLLYHVALKSGLNDAEAQDVVQETVISVARQMPEFRYDPSKGSFKHWLLLITRRRIQDQLRRKYRSAARGEDRSGYVAANGENREDNWVSPEPAPDAIIEAAWEEEWRENVYQAALTRVRERVHPKSFQAFDYCVIQGLSVTEVGRLLGMNAAQIYVAKHRVSASLKRAVADLEKELSGAKG